jgi:hypothetical protein
MRQPRAGFVYSPATPSSGIAMVGNNLYFAYIHGSFRVFNALFKNAAAS